MLQEQTKDEIIADLREALTALFNRVDCHFICSGEEMESELRDAWDMAGEVLERAKE